jgi:hypothetical protein
VGRNGGTGATGPRRVLPLLHSVMAPDAPFWFETIAHRGRAAYHRRGAAYTVFRNVRDFGAVGDGATDDTAAIMCGALCMRWAECKAERAGVQGGDGERRAVRGRQVRVDDVSENTGPQGAVLNAPRRVSPAIVYFPRGSVAIIRVNICAIV